MCISKSSAILNLGYEWGNNYLYKLLKIVDKSYKLDYYIIIQNKSEQWEWVKLLM